MTGHSLPPAGEGEGTRCALLGWHSFRKENAVAKGHLEACQEGRVGPDWFEYDRWLPKNESNDDEDKT